MALCSYICPYLVTAGISISYYVIGHSKQSTSSFCCSSGSSYDGPKIRLEVALFVYETTATVVEATATVAVPTV
jgi:hypothetical protein